MDTEAAADHIAEALAADAGPGVPELYRADEAVRRIFTREANRVRRFIAAELREASRIAWDSTPEGIATYLSNRADEMDPPR